MKILNFTTRKRVNRGWILALLSSLILFGTSCTKEEYDLEDLKTGSPLIKTALAAPIGSVKMGLNDLVRHDGINGELITDEKIYELAEVLKLPLPLNCNIGSQITGRDTITGIDLNEYIGESKIINSLHVVYLNFDIENQFPMNALIKVVFMSEDSLDGELFYQDIASEKLKIEIAMSGANNLASPSDPITTSKSSQEIKIEGDAQTDLMKATAARIEYELTLDNISSVYLVENQYLKLDISAYLKADVLLND